MKPTCCPKPTSPLPSPVPLIPGLATLAPVIPAEPGITAADGKLIFVNELSGGQSELEVA